MTEDEKQDAIAWLEDAAHPEGGHASEAKLALQMIQDAEDRENRVLGMCMARQPHDEIRDYLLAVSE